MALQKTIIIDGAQLEYWKLAGFSLATTEKEARIVMDGYISKDYYDQGGKAGKQFNAVIQNRVEVKQITNIKTNDETGEEEKHEVVTPLEINDFDAFNQCRIAVGIEEAAYEYIKGLSEFADAADI